MAGATAERMFLIDAYSLIFQVFHAVDKSMTSPTGLPVNALFGFARDLLYLRGRKPDYLICVFDEGEPTNRTSIYKDYKAHRPPMDEDLAAQLPHIRRLVAALSIPALAVPGVEADDSIATVARSASARGIDVYICTSDKDCRQLLDDHVRMYSLRKKTEFGCEELLKDWGITPEQVVDFQSLVGDNVDNVPGVKGVGEKTAALLLQEHGTLDNILHAVAQPEPVGILKRPALQKNLREWAAKDQISRQLVRLDTNVSIPLDWENWKLQPLDKSKAAPLFRELGFRTFLAQVLDSDDERAAPVGTRQVSLFAESEEAFPFGANVRNGEAPAETPTPIAEPWNATYHLVDSAETFRDFFSEIKKQTRFAIDLETTSLNPLEAEIVGIAITWKEGEAYYLALRGPEGAKLLDPKKTLERLRSILEDATVQKVNQNIKYDLLVFRSHGIAVAGVVGDSMIADYLLHPGERSHGLDQLAEKFLNHRNIPITDLIGKKPRANEKGPAQLSMDEVPPERVAAYSGEDADVALRLCGILEPQLAPAGLANLYRDLEIPLIEVLAELEFNGIRLDIPMLKRVGEEMARQLAEIERAIYDAAGHEFNVASLKQLRTVLFEEQKLPIKRKTRTTGEAQTDQETLEDIAIERPDNPIPRLILQHRQLSKLAGTYVGPLPGFVNPRTGRIHTSFSQTAAETGRLSSSDPNLQNIPVRREQGQDLRRAFLPEEGWTLLTADYSQVELRLLAHFCADSQLRQAYAEDRDVHALVAARVFGVEEKDVTAEMRRVAKTVNFGVIYGMSAHGLAQRLRIPRREAEQFIDAYFARYPRVLEYQRQLLEHCRKTGYVGTILGRKRQFEKTNIRRHSTYRQRNQTEREAINMEIQGSAADLIKLAMLHVYRRLQRERRRTRMLLQIHDELVFEVPPEELPSVAALLREEMATARERELKLLVPLRVELAGGPNWLDVEDIQN
jgi:DNA polymerase-1